MRKIFIAAVVACVAAAFAASPVSAQEGDLEAFCDASLEVDVADEPSPELLEELQSTAPPEIAASVETAVTTFEELGEDAFEDEAFNAAIVAMDTFVAANCGFEIVDVDMGDYSFSGIPSELPTGVVALQLSNTGEEFHELTLYRLKGDKTLDDVLDLPDDAKEKAYKKLLKEVPGGGFAEPGASDLALIELKKPGNYVALCFIPVGSTPENAEEGGDGPPHLHAGMATEFEVTG